MLKIKDFNIISGLEGNATDGWYMYSNVSQYTVTIQVDVETDVANAAEVMGISSFYIRFGGTITQQSQSVNSTTTGVQITAIYLIDRNEFIQQNMLEKFCSFLGEIEIIVTDQVNTDTYKDAICIFAPSSYFSFYCSDIKLYQAEYINNKVTKCYTGPNIYAELTIFFDPASNYSIEDCQYKLYDVESADVEYTEANDIILGPIIYQKKIKTGYYIVGTMIYNINNTLYNYINSNRNPGFEIGCITSVFSDFSDYLNMVGISSYCGMGDLVPYSYMGIIDQPTIYFSTNNTVSIIGPNRFIYPTSLTSNTDALHVWGNITANNIADATSRLTTAQATLTTLNDMFTIETVVTRTYTTKTANTLEDTGITFGDLEAGAIYAFYSDYTHGRIADLRIKAKNGSGSDIYFYEYCLNTNTSMRYALPVFYCHANKGSSYGDYHLLVSRTATGSNTYTLYKILGPLL